MQYAVVVPFYMLVMAAGSSILLLYVFDVDNSSFSFQQLWWWCAQYPDAHSIKDEAIIDRYCTEYTPIAIHHAASNCYKSATHDVFI